MRKHLILALAAAFVMTAAGCAGNSTRTTGNINGDLSQTTIENGQQAGRETSGLSGSGNTDNAAENVSITESAAVIGEEAVTGKEAVIGEEAVTGKEAVIGEEAAKAIALEKAGLSGKDVVFTETSFEQDDGVTCYQIDFIYGTTEYEVEIDANSGAIIEYEAESVND